MDRIAGWLERFADRHGVGTWTMVDGQAQLQAPDGAVARVELPLPPSHPSATNVVASAHAFDTFSLVLVRRGGFAVGRVEDGHLVASKCGTRYVQGRTKAGGWSQQRYARRRANQAADVAAAAADAVTAVLGRSAAAVVAGGDRPLVRTVLDSTGSEEGVVRWLDVPDPRHTVLVSAVEPARAARIALNALA